MQSDGWHPYENGQTLGETGTEKGRILRDEVHPEGARITLERDGYMPFAITCGIYGWFVHTTYFGAESDAETAFENMKRELVRIATLTPLNDDPNVDNKLTVLYDAFSAFTRAFP